jgi:hypothetical protein
MAGVVVLKTTEAAQSIATRLGQPYVWVADLIDIDTELVSERGYSEPDWIYTVWRKRYPQRPPWRRQIERVYNAFCEYLAEKGLVENVSSS